MTLRIVPASGELLEQWRAVHNTVIPAAPLTAQEVVERATRNELTLGYVGDTLVGNATVRAPLDGAITVIVRILPEHRRQGLGGEYLRAVLPQARERADRITTVVLAANVDGLAFALRHGFVETQRYDVDGAAFIDLVLQGPTP